MASSAGSHQRYSLRIKRSLAEGGLLINGKNSRLSGRESLQITAIQQSIRNIVRPYGD